MYCNFHQPSTKPLHQKNFLSIYSVFVFAMQIQEELEPMIN